MTETNRILQMIRAGATSGMTELQFFAYELHEWKGSQTRRDQILGDRYYRGLHDILERKRTVIGADGKLQTVENLPNNRLVDNQYAKMVDQKANYLLGKPLTLDGENKQYIDQLNGYFGEKFRRVMKSVGEDSLNGGIAWLYLYYDEQGEFCFKRFPPYEILPFWKDDDHMVLDCAVRLYIQEVWEGFRKKSVEKVEIYKPDGIYRYVLDGFVLIPDVEAGEYTPYFTVTNEQVTLKGYNWNRIPLIGFKYNNKEIPLINRVKSLQDGINTMLSDFENNIQEDPRNTILVIENYDGENLDSFRHNLATYGAVKVRSDNGARGGVSTLTVEVNSDNYRAILELFKNALIENARGYDAKDDRLSGNPNKLNIMSMYSDIDLDANGMETEYQAAFRDIIWFICQHLTNSGKENFTAQDVTVVFNRDILINESQVIADIRNSVGILSNETLIAQHPYVVDAKEELARLKGEQAEELQRADAYGGAFPPSGNDGKAAP